MTRCKRRKFCQLRKLTPARLEPMWWLEPSSRMSLAIVGVLLLLLVALATLQHRWIAQLSDAERARLQEGLDQAAADFCGDFDREIARAFSVFKLELNSKEELPRLLAERLAEWQSTATWPGLVKELLIVRNREADEVVLLCFEEQSQRLVACNWDDELRPIRHSLGGPGPGVPVVSSALPGLVLAVQEHGPPKAGTLSQWRPPGDHLVVRFDLAFIADTLLPWLAESHFGLSDDRPYILSVSSIDRPGETVFQSRARAPSRTQKPDATGRLLGLRSFQELSGAAPAGPRMRRPPPPGRRPEHRAGGPPQKPPPSGLRVRTEEGHWVLTIHHPAGSLERVIQKTRRRNMAVSLATMAMLGVTTLLILVSTRRAQQLARQQMDFVAIISHELRTPLTAIRSAGQNLADGIISDPPKVRSYGLLIEREGRRLTEMIGRVLAFAGIRSGRQNFQMATLDLTEIIEAALADWRWTLDEKGIEVEKTIAPHLPPVQGDSGALRLVVTNLIDNAIKYGAAGRWLGVSAGVDSENDPSTLWIAVSDHGPGIPRREQQRLFQAFRRGAEAATGTVPGSGLGLAVVRGVVEAHEGSIEVNSSPGNGTTFTVRLPAVRTELIRGEKP
ncbi:MAG: HAMP domain-containing histidine kinase [bacterium]|nr:HAMP domain-containing histidine kinase [bacterium]